MRRMASDRVDSAAPRAAGHRPVPGCWPDAAQRLLLRAALGEGDDARTAWEAWAAQTDLDTLDPGAHRLLPLLARTLQGLGVEHPMLRKLRGIHRQTWADNQLLLHRTARHVAALREAGIPVMVLKGAALLLERCYADVGLRPMRDLDLLVPPQDARRAVGILQARGLAPKPGLMRAEAMMVLSNGTGLVDTDGVELDVHWTLLPEAQQSGVDDAVWAGAAPRTMSGVEVFVPHRADLLVHTCVHGLAWNEVPPVRWAADAILLLRATPALDWDRVCATAESHGVAFVMARALDWLRGTLGARVPDTVLSRLRAADALGDRIELGVKTRAWPLPGPVYVGAGNLLRYRWWARGRGERVTPLGWARYAAAKVDPGAVRAALAARRG